MGVNVGHKRRAGQTFARYVTYILRTREYFTGFACGAVCTPFPVSASPQELIRPQRRWFATCVARTSFGPVFNSCIVELRNVCGSDGPARVSISQLINRLCAVRSCKRWQFTWHFQHPSDRRTNNGRRCANEKNAKVQKKIEK